MDRIVFDTPVGPMALEGTEEGLTALYLPNCPMEPAGKETPLEQGAPSGPAQGVSQIPPNTEARS